MRVNCENTRICRPSATSVGRVARNQPILALSALSAATCSAGPGASSKRGSLQTWRSRNSASRMLTVAPANFCRASTRRTCSSQASRTLSYSARCAPVSATRCNCSVSAGNSVATTSLRRRRINGATRCASSRARTVSPFFSIGVRQSRWKLRASPRYPGSKKWNCAHSSPKWFSIGVPVRLSRCRALSRRAAVAVRLPAFLTICASSSTTRCQGWACSAIASRHSSG